MIMIKATGIKNNGFVIETTEKVSGAIQRVTVASETDCLKIAYYWNRLYINEKMLAFLKQRIVAFRIARQLSLEVKTSILLNEVQRCQTGCSLHTLCKTIADNEDLITAIAPREQSQHYHFYKDTVTGIVMFCREMQGAELKLCPSPKGETAS